LVGRTNQRRCPRLRPADGHVARSDDARQAERRHGRLFAFRWLYAAWLIVQLPTAILAGTAGVWLFYVQHQFEHTTWANDEDWNLHHAALHGSSHYDLPAFLRWFTANIGVHHVHHLNSRIPYYRLPRVLRDHPELRTVGRLTLIESFRCVRLVLWDGTQRRLISFRELRTAG
jgi:omega-6 fatty acid desaturase (delta-12 desaturase)